jgi:hypothetical protein
VTHRGCDTAPAIVQREITVTFLYIDPGAGSLVIQALLAAILAIPFFFREQVGRAVAAFRGRRKVSDESRPEA